MAFAEDMAFLWSYHDARGNSAWMEATEEDRAAAWGRAVADFDAAHGTAFGESPAGVYLRPHDVTTEDLFALADGALAAVLGADQPEEPKLPDADKPAPAEAEEPEQPKPRRGRPPRVVAD